MRRESNESFDSRETNASSECYGAAMSYEQKPLHPGDEMTMTEFARRRDDATLLVVSGGHIYLTRRGKRRMALVPAEVAEKHYSMDSTDTNAATDDEEGES